jgi:hypothetical protein
VVIVAARNPIEHGGEEGAMPRERQLFVGLTAILLAAVTANLAPGSSARASQDVPARLDKGDLAGLHDFDFFVGDWQAHHKRLKERLAGSDDWEEFEGWCRNRALLDGWVNADDSLFRTPRGDARGVGLAAYDPKTGRWGAWWLDGADPFAKLDPPSLGGFKGGVGTFYGDDTLRGKPVRVRVVWSKITPTSVHWEQAFSGDGGKTWETNWVTDFTRTTAVPALLLAPKPAPGADLSGLHAFDGRVGKWIGHNKKLKERLAGSHEWESFDGTQTFWTVLGGYGNLDENRLRTQAGDYPGVTLRAYDAKSGRWSIWWLDDRNPLGALEPPVRGRFENGIANLYSDDTLRGKPIKVRFTWSGITEKTAHWEQAFSGDGGRTWETNWLLDFEPAP